MEYAVKALGITHIFGEKSVLSHIDLKIQKGEVFGLLGPSGAGKTTLIKILTGQLKPCEGTAELFGMDTEKLKSSDYRNIGIMMDNFGLYERLSCYDNLKIFTTIYGLPKDRIGEALKSVGLGETGRTAVMRLSKGMKSRMRLARVLLQKPAILFLDEPTSGLDPATASDIHRLLKKEQEKGTTIVLTTHNMSEAARLCGQSVLLNEGHIVEQGSPAEICRRYNHQKKIRLHLYDGRDLEIANASSSARLLEKCLLEELVETIHTTEPSLETVFMELTGRGFD